MTDTQFADLVVDGEQYDAAVLGTSTVAEPPASAPAVEPPAEGEADAPEPPDTAAQAEASDSEAEPTRNEDGTFAKKGKEPYQSKVGRLKAEADAAKAEAAAIKAAKEAAERRAAELESRLAAQARATERPTPAPRETFPAYEAWVEAERAAGRDDQYDRYLDDRADWRADQRWQQREREVAARARQERWQSKVEAAKASRPDWDAVMSQGQSLLVTDELRDALLEAEQPLMVYHLIQHPEEYRRLVELRGTALAKAIGKLEARLETESSGQVQATPVIPPKPAPISPLGGGTAVAAESRSDEDSTVITVGSDWLRKENAKDRERGRLRA